jgi:hypothetical protein
MPRGYLGIDFGTSNSHFAYTMMDDPKGTKSVQFEGEKSIPTCVLVPRNGPETAAWIGNEAIRSWVLDADQFQMTHRFSAGFKPDIRSSPEARGDARIFLHCCYRRMHGIVGLSGLGESAGMPVIVGVPAEIPEEQKERTKEIAKAAGFGDVACVDEPLGALAHHMICEEVGAEQARKGVIVVDFGGGTLDVAMVSRKGRGRIWGDPLLGGRLFDDLFFTWFCDEDPSFREAMGKVSGSDRTVVWCIGCREEKERFSRAWSQAASDPGVEDPWSVAIDPAPRLKLALADAMPVRIQGTVAEFKRRARSYVPSQFARDYFRKVDSPLQHKLGSGPVDLIAWIEKAVGGGDPLDGLDSETVVVLTGGSCRWPFMKPLVQRVLGLKNVLISNDPEATIGQGLSQYFVLKTLQDRRSTAILSDKPAILERIGAEAKSQVDDLTKRMAGRVADLALAEVRPIFLRWYEVGGSLDRVAKNAEKAIKARGFAVETERILKEESETLHRQLLGFMRRIIEDLLKRHGITLVQGSFHPTFGGDATPSSDAFKRLFDNLFGTMNAHISNIVAIVVSFVVSIVLAKIAIIFGWNPGGWLLAAVVGFGSGTAAAGWIRQHEFNAVTLTLLKITLSKARLEARLREGRDNLEAEIAPAISKKLDELAAELTTVVEKTIEQVIHDLGILDEF